MFLMCRAEVDRILSRDRENSEINQQMQYKIDCLETELLRANQVPAVTYIK